MESKGAGRGAKAELSGMGVCGEACIFFWGYLFGGIYVYGGPPLFGGSRGTSCCGIFPVWDCRGTSFIDSSSIPLSVLNHDEYSIYNSVIIMRKKKLSFPESLWSSTSVDGKEQYGTSNNGFDRNNCEESENIRNIKTVKT